MIDCLGFYLTRNGQVVEVTRILQSQPIAEGYIVLSGYRDTFHIWNIDGTFNRLKESDHDIVRFMYGHTTNESFDD